MDLFSKLTPEIRLIILESVADFIDAIALSRASPIMFRFFRQFETSIRIGYVRNIFGEDLMQDAVAIITFPEAPKTLKRIRHNEAVCAHLRQWGRKDLPDLKKSRTLNLPLMYELKALHDRLWLYIEDFLSKATSEFLPRAYRRLPKWCLFSETDTQIQLHKEAKEFDRNSLSETQKRQILQAFLRYELLCRVYGPRGNDFYFIQALEFKTFWGSGAEPTGMIYNYQFDQSDPFRYWDWALLNKYEKKVIEGPVLQLLPCIREYVLTLYEAYAAEELRLSLPISTDRGHPEFEVGVSTEDIESPLDTPEGVFDCHKSDWSEQAASLAVSGGFDLLTSILLFGNKDKTLDRLKGGVLGHHGRKNATNINVPIEGPVSFVKISWYANKFIRLYRQRAWPLFEERKLGPKLPTEAEYSSIYGPGPRGGQIQWGLDKECARNEQICHGSGIWTARGLSKKKPCRIGMVHSDGQL